MKRIFTYGSLFVVCLSFFTSCSKDVKAPAKRTNNTNTTAKTAPPTTTTTTTGTSTPNQGTHTCGYSGSSH
jgi:hypothetical protein